MRLGLARVSQTSREYLHERRIDGERGANARS